MRLPKLLEIVLAHDDPAANPGRWQLTITDQTPNGTLRNPKADSGFSGSHRTNPIGEPPASGRAPRRGQSKTIKKTAGTILRCPTRGQFEQG